MVMATDQAKPWAFDYPQTPHDSKHGPLGYANPEAYKPWIRDEYDYRCVYCLCRERWFPDGAASFSVDHSRPVRLAPESRTDYQNLRYACCQCNAIKKDAILPADPVYQPFGKHLHVADNGQIVGRTPVGWQVIETCRLDRPRLSSYRQRLITLLRKLESNDDAANTELYVELLGFPVDVPDLRTLLPPAGNSKPAGINRSAFVLKSQNQLPQTY